MTILLHLTHAHLSFRRPHTNTYVYEKIMFNYFRIKLSQYEVTDLARQTRSTCVLGLWWQDIICGRRVCGWNAFIVLDCWKEWINGYFILRQTRTLSIDSFFFYFSSRLYCLAPGRRSAKNRNTELLSKVSKAAALFRVPGGGVSVLRRSTPALAGE